MHTRFMCREGVIVIDANCPWTAFRFAVEESPKILYSMRSKMYLFIRIYPNPSRSPVGVHLMFQT